MSSFFKASLLCSLGSLLLWGCSSMPSGTAQPGTSIHNVTAEGIGASLGKVYFQDSSRGLVITTDLHQLPPGDHGFHIHEQGSCAPAEKDGKMQAALAAGGHFNPTQVAHHGTPMTGHLGDLPVLHVNTQGEAKTVLLAPRLKLADIQGRAIMIHADGDNYSDLPKPLGGGGTRIACGVI